MNFRMEIELSNQDMSPELVTQHLSGVARFLARLPKDTSQTEYNGDIFNCDQERVGHWTLKSD